VFNEYLTNVLFNQIDFLLKNVLVLQNDKVRRTV